MDGTTYAFWSHEPKRIAISFPCHDQWINWAVSNLHAGCVDQGSSISPDQAGTSVYSYGGFFYFVYNFQKAGKTVGCKFYHCIEIWNKKGMLLWWVLLSFHFCFAGENESFSDNNMAKTSNIRSVIFNLALYKLLQVGRISHEIYPQARKWNAWCLTIFRVVCYDRSIGFLPDT